MKHKFRIRSFALAAILAATFGLAACGGNGGTGGNGGNGGTGGGGGSGEPQHTHTFASTWTSDEEFHWHAATCTDTDEKKDKAAHDYKNGVCGTCSYAHKNHSFVGTTCTVCGYTIPSSKLRFEEVLAGDGETVAGYSVIGWDESVTDRTRLVIPAEYSGKPVVAVGDNAFDIEDGDGDETLATVYLPESVKNLGEYAFYGCAGLKNINLEHVENLYQGAFYECTGLERAEMGSLKTLGQYAFYGCTALTFVRLEGAETFEDQAFRNCPALERAEFGDEIESFPEYTFYESEGVKELSFGKEFSQTLTASGLPEGLESIEVSSENANYASEGGILYNKAKTEIAIAPKSMKGRVTIADGVKELKKSMIHFMNHAYITSLTLPASVEKIERRSFSGCNVLAEIYNPSAVEITDVERFGLNEEAVVHTALSEKSIVTDPDENGFVWRTDKDVLHTYFGKETKLTLPDGHEGRAYAVATCAFCRNPLEKVTIPSKVTALGISCFVNCKQLKEVVIGEGTEEIGESAFSNCTALTKITIPKSVKKIGAGAFYQCMALERVDFTGTVSQWAAIEFENSNSNIFVNSTKEKQAVLYLGDGKPLPEKITIEGIEKVGNYAFYGSPVQEVVIGAGVKKIGQDAFTYCADLKSVVIGKEVEFFYYAFSNGSPIETFYYEGTQDMWKTLNNGNGGSSALKSAAVSYFSEKAPTAEQWSAGANWWHFGADGFAVAWTK